MNKNEVSDYLKNLDKNTNIAAVEVDGKIYSYERKISGEWEGSNVDEPVRNRIKEQVEKELKDKDLQGQLDTEKENSTKLKTITDQLLEEKMRRIGASDSRKGGGVTKLDNYNKSQDMVYDTISEGISDLYSRVRKGDKEARKKLDELNALAIDDIKVRSAKNESFYLVRCVACGQMNDVNKISGSKCVFCGERLGISG